MNAQQIITLALVAVAAVYLGRRLVQSVRDLFSPRSGCSSGCGKCGFARELATKSAAASSERRNIIPLSEIGDATSMRSGNKLH
jgi:bacterioferritin-associated ferredoxin